MTPASRQGGADDRAACTRRATCDRGRRSRRSGPRAHLRETGKRGKEPENGKGPALGGFGRPSQPGALRWGDRSGAHIEVDPRGDLVHFDLVTISMPLRDPICPIVITGVHYRSSDGHGTLERMDVRQLQALVAVAEHGTFSGAAKALHTVQSNISAHVARLERELGVKLVDRHSGRLTAEGTAVVARARRVQSELDVDPGRRRAPRHRAERRRALRRDRHHGPVDRGQRARRAPRAAPPHPHRRGGGDDHLARRSSCSRATSTSPW